MASSPYLGQIQAFSFDWAPKYWAQCNGQIMAINQNQALFSLLGTVYGGNGSTTFQLPNLQSRAPRGQGQGVGVSPCVMGQVAGVENVSLTVTNLPMHNHVLVGSAGTAPKASSAVGTVSAPSATENTLAALTDPNLSVINNFYNAVAPDITLNTGSTTPSLSVSGGSQPVSIMQPFLAINFCIAVAGIYPSRN